MANSLLYIACLFRDFCLTFCCGDSSSSVFFGTLLIGFGFCLTGPACMTNAERSNDSTRMTTTSPAIASIPIITPPVPILLSGNERAGY
nr:hypothetical protein [Klebsiella pneumoniae]